MQERAWFSVPLLYLNVAASSPVEPGSRCDRRCNQRTGNHVGKGVKVGGLILPDLLIELTAIRSGANNTALQAEIIAASEATKEA
eukprot:2676572-Pleurochrysis_carterae.AAC.1